MRRLALCALVSVAVLGGLAVRAEAASVKLCGSVTSLVDEGNHRATIRVRVLRPPDTSCATARAVAQAAFDTGVSQQFQVAGRTWRLHNDAQNGRIVGLRYTSGGHQVSLQITTRRA